MVLKIPGRSVWRRTLEVLKGNKASLKATFDPAPRPRATRTTLRCQRCDCRHLHPVLASASSGERTRELFVRPSPLASFEGPRPSAFIGCANVATLSSLNTCSPQAQARAKELLDGPRLFAASR